MKLLKRSFLIIACMVVILFFSLLPVRNPNSYSADNGQIVAIGSDKIQIIEIDGSRAKDVYSGIGDNVNPICLPNGNGIVFVRYVKSGRDAVRELFLLEPKQKEPIQITFDMNVRIQFAVAADGKQVAYVSNITKQVHIVRLDTRQSTQLTTIPAGVPQGSSQRLAWSPDSKRLALAFHGDLQQSFRTAYYVLDTVTRRLVPIPTPPGNASVTWSPWSPDGTKLALGDMARTLIVDVASDPPRIVREFSGYVRDVHWSPDGTKLAFIQGQEGKYCDGVYVLDLQSGSTKRVASPSFFGRRCFHGPSWSRDSKMLAFLGFYSPGDMSVLPWPERISDQLYIADKDMRVRSVIEDLKTSNTYGVSWCATPPAFGK
jgi:Tol biopolymer transport system component